MHMLSTCTVKPVLSGHLKQRSYLMKVISIAEGSLSAILLTSMKR